MIVGFLSWFRSRTGREQLLLKFAALVIIGGGGLLFAYQAASSYRATAAADLASAVQLRDDLARLKTLEGSAAAVPVPASDGSVRGVATAVAGRLGLNAARIEPEGPTGVRMSFDPANAQTIYQWLDAVERAGLVVSRIILARAGEGDIVEASATIASRS
jgi:type II secretory pathway component PulM